MIKKAVVLAAGKGSRLDPLTRAIPKEMIRVGLKPVIEHVIKVLSAGGIEEILIIVGPKKESIMNHLGSGERLGVNIYYRVQEEPKGTAHAVLQSEGFIGDDTFVVMYGDNYFKPYESMNYIRDFHESNSADATLVLYPVDDPTRFGIVKINDKRNILGIIEKPKLNEALPYKVKDKYLNIAGLMIVTSEIFEYIEKTKPGINNEIWLTDSIELMRLDCRKIMGYVFKGVRYDIGTYESLIEADRLEHSERINITP